MSNSSAVPKGVLLEQPLFHRNFKPNLVDMAHDPSNYHDRYDVSGNVEAEYVDTQQTVLINKLGVAKLEELQLLEEELLAKAYETLSSEVRLGTPLTTELICYVHQRIFGELYSWAGRWRTVNISKPGVTWPPPAYIDTNMTALEHDVLRKYTPGRLTDDEAFCKGVAEIQGEFLVIHPFREGNARTIKLVTDLLASQTGRPLLAYEKTDRGRDLYIAAASQAFGRNFAPMEAVIRRALATARKGPATPP